jgi:hypothetical protein
MGLLVALGVKVLLGGASEQTFNLCIWEFKITSLISRIILLFFLLRACGHSESFYEQLIVLYVMVPRYHLASN